MDTMPTPQPGRPTFDLEVIGDGLVFANVLGDLRGVLETGPTAVVQAPPGTGKTTLVPPLVANLLAARGAEGHGKVIVTQPRRVAARSAARRLAQLDGSPLGARSGYSVRGERKASPTTDVEFVTPGLLLRRLLADPELTGVDAVILDEVHERQLDTDLLLGLLGEVRELRDDLTLVAMSATLDAPRFANLLGTDGEPAPLVDSPTALHPLTVSYAPASGPRQDDRGVTPAFLEHVARTAADAHATALRKDPATDALVFLPGAREVSRVAEKLRSLTPGVEILELSGSAPAAEQDRAVSGREPGGRPRFIVSTALAESSLTVPGVRLVIDAGLSREPRRDAARGMQGLVTVQASRASADQRAGRAARLGPGTVVRCYEERTLAAAPAHITPEILSADLTQAALTLAAWGTPRGEGLALPDTPPPAAMRDAEATLRSLGAVDADGRATALGTRLAELPLEPRWGRALLDGVSLASERGLTPVAVAWAVAVATSDQRVPDGDLAALARQVTVGHGPVRREAARLQRLVGHTSSGNERPTAALVARALPVVAALAWPERIARRVAPNVYLLASGTRAGLPGGSGLGHSEWLAISDVTRAGGRAAAGTGAVIRAAAALDEVDALELAGDLLVEETRAEFVEGKVRARQVRALGAIELASTPVRADAESGAAAVAVALREQGLGVLHFSESADAVRRRLAFLHRELGEPWPDVADAALLARLDEWLAPELRRLAGGAPATKIDLTDPLRRLLPWPEAARLDELAPERLRVPSGNTAAVDYPAVGDDGPPVVAVKLQECFGWAETPRLADGQAPVLFHLLSPARRPLAVTDDLASFWSGPYAQVRSEMRGRYPKHPWPEDPWSARATHLTKRRLEGK
jgi:ATP-dependent helicase HrpB